MGKELVAVVGIGQTRHQATRGDVSIAGLVREAAVEALDDAGMTWADVDAVVVGKAPDFFEGVMMPELYLADALGAVGKPLLRVHTAGSVGGSTALVAASLVQARIHRRVLTVAFEKQSESEAMWALTLPIPFSPPLEAFATPDADVCPAGGEPPGEWRHPCLSGPRELLPRPRLEPAEWRHRHHQGRTCRRHERHRLPDAWTEAARHRHRPPVRRGAQGRSGRDPHPRRRVRALAPAQPGRDEAQEHGPGDWVHAVAGAEQPDRGIAGEVVGDLARQHDVHRALPHRRDAGARHGAGNTGTRGERRGRIAPDGVGPEVLPPS